MLYAAEHELLAKLEARKTFVSSSTIPRYETTYNLGTARMDWMSEPGNWTQLFSYTISRNRQLLAQRMQPEYK